MGIFDSITNKFNDWLYDGKKELLDHTIQSIGFYHHYDIDLPNGDPCIAFSKGSSEGVQIYLGNVELEKYFHYDETLLKCKDENKPMFAQIGFMGDGYLYEDVLVSPKIRFSGENAEKELVAFCREFVKNESLGEEIFAGKKNEQNQRVSDGVSSNLYSGGVKIEAHCLDYRVEQKMTDHAVEDISSKRCKQNLYVLNTPVKNEENQVIGYMPATTLHIAGLSEKAEKLLVSHCEEALKDEHSPLCIKLHELMAEEHRFSETKDFGLLKNINEKLYHIGEDMTHWLEKEYGLENKTVLSIPIELKDNVRIFEENNTKGVKLLSGDNEMVLYGVKDCVVGDDAIQLSFDGGKMGLEAVMGYERWYAAHLDRMVKEQIAFDKEIVLEENLRMLNDTLFIPKNILNRYATCEEREPGQCVSIHLKDAGLEEGFTLTADRLFHIHDFRHSNDIESVQYHVAQSIDITDEGAYVKLPRRSNAEESIKNITAITDRMNQWLESVNMDLGFTIADYKKRRGNIRELAKQNNIPRFKMVTRVHTRTDKIRPDNKENDLSKSR